MRTRSIRGLGEFGVAGDGPPAFRTAPHLDLRLAPSIHCRRLIGRGRELEFLVHRRRDLGKGHGGIVLVRGDAGIGKSRLVREFLDATGKARGRVAIGRCRPFTSRPYEALDEVLEAFRSGATPLLPAASKDEQRSRIVDALLACAGRHACVAIVEDLHWADRETIAVIALLAEVVASKRLLVVATYRGSDVHNEHPLYGDLAALQRSEAVRELHLGPRLGNALPFSMQPTAQSSRTPPSSAGTSTSICSPRRLAPTSRPSYRA